LLKAKNKIFNLFALPWRYANLRKYCAEP
jgi:hypothetical protein